MSVLLRIRVQEPSIEDDFVELKEKKATSDTVTESSHNLN
jgi:hypothetical protein